jgi:hypothetical protein
MILQRLPPASQNCAASAKWLPDKTPPGLPAERALKCRGMWMGGPGRTRANCPAWVSAAAIYQRDSVRIAGCIARFSSGDVISSIDRADKSATDFLKSSRRGSHGHAPTAAQAPIYLSRRAGPRHGRSISMISISPASSTTAGSCTPAPSGPLVDMRSMSACWKPARARLSSN